MMVVTKAPISDVPEPIYAHSGHSPPISRDSDHRQFQKKIKSAELKSLDGGFKKANGIVHGGSGILNSKPFSLAALENNKALDASIGKMNTQVKRPALGHKPARFSLGKPPVDLDPSLNIDHLQDPVKFFFTYENLQYAKDDIQRYTGGNVTNMNDCKPFAPCCLWSGISGQYLCFQKPVSYMHDYSSTVSENDDTFVSSKEALQENNLCPAELVSHQETVNSVIEQQNKELAGSISKTDNRINELVDKLLSEIIENLDGDGALSLLPEGLQIRPVDRRNNVPDFSGTGKTDLMDLEEKLRNNRKSLARIQKVMRGLNGKTPVKSKQVAENLIHTLDSPTTPKSPFAALSLLNKHISQSKPSHDPFLVLDIDLLPSARNTIFCEDIDQLSEQLHKGTEKSTPDKQKSPTEVEATALPGTVLKNVIEGATHSLLDKSVNVHSSSGRDMLQEVISYPQYCISIEESSRSCTTVVTLEHGSCDMDDDIKDSTSAVQLNINTDDSTTKNSTFAYSLSGQSDSTFTEELSLNGQQIVAINCLEQHNKALRKGSTKDINRARRTQKRKRRKQMANSQSLLEAGTYWESGVRRSKRKRTRPLEFWKGERFLYGRVHKSLATVIGIKCISLATGSEEATFKVSSYVSDKYKDLVELAALH